MIGLKDSFRLMYSNIHLKSRETLPLISEKSQYVLFSCRFIQYCKADKPWELIHKEHTVKITTEADSSHKKQDGSGKDAAFMYILLRC